MRNTILLILICAFLSSNAQIDVASFTVTGAGYSTAVVTDYQCLGINPANLGWKRNDFNFSVGAGEAGFTIYSEPLKRALVKELFDKDIVFTSEQKEDAVRNFTNSKLQLNGEGNAFGVSFQDEKIGGIGFSVREKMMWNSNLNEASSEFLFYGYNAPYFDSLAVVDGDTIGYATKVLKTVSELFSGTSLSLLWYREYGLAYGRTVYNSENFAVYGGVGFKFLKGYGVFDYRYDDNGKLLAYSALNPVFEVNYDTYSPSRIEGNDYQPVGTGYSLDFGLSILVKNKFRFALALNDLGQIKWDGNVYEGEDGILENIETAGLSNYNIFEEGQNIAVENTNWGEWIGLENKTVKLPMRLRSGAAYIPNERFEFGTDFIIPVNDVPGSYDKLIWGLGTRIFATKWLRCSTGIITGGKFGTGIPLGVSFFPFNNHTFTWELGLAINDVTTYFSQNKPTVSLALGLMRFSFGDVRSQPKNIKTTE